MVVVGMDLVTVPLIHCFFVCVSPIHIEITFCLNQEPVGPPEKRPRRFANSFEVDLMDRSGRPNKTNPERSNRIINQAGICVPFRGPLLNARFVQSYNV